MENEEVTELIIEILTFCDFQEVPHFVNEEGAFVYREDLSYTSSRITYKYIDNYIHICNSAAEWRRLDPKLSLDDCAYLITRISHILDYKLRKSKKEAEWHLYEKLHKILLKDVLDLMRTLNGVNILFGIASFLRLAKSTIDKLKDNQ